MNKLRIISLFFISVAFIGNIVFTGISYSEVDRSEEINQFIEQLKSNSNIERITAAKRIENSGLSDPGLFNVINEILLNIDHSKRLDSDYVDELSWYCKALASSGRLEYKETLETVYSKSESNKLKKYAKQSLGRIDEYAGRNEIMSNTSNVSAGPSPEINKYMNMLKSGNSSMIKNAAKHLYRNPSLDPILFKTANDVLLKEYKNNNNNSRHTDAMAWLCKALGASGNPEYKVTLEEVINSSSWDGNHILERYARKSLAMLK